MDKGILSHLQLLTGPIFQCPTLPTNPQHVVNMVVFLIQPEIHLLQIITHPYIVHNTISHEKAKDQQLFGRRFHLLILIIHLHQIVLSMMVFLTHLFLNGLLKLDIHILLKNLIQIIHLHLRLLTHPMLLLLNTALCNLLTNTLIQLLIQLLIRTQMNPLTTTPPPTP